VVFDSAAIAALDAVAALSGGGPEPQRGMSGAAANHPTLSAISNKKGPAWGLFCLIQL